jgi:hypothetical protein
MTSAELLTSVIDRLDSLEARTRAAFDKLDDDAANKPVPPSNWSPYQILDHLMKSDVPYLPLLRDAIANAPDGDSVAVRHSFFGKFIIKGAGPSGNAPAPRPLIPDPGPHSRAVLDNYLVHARELRSIFVSAKGKDLNLPRFNNPFVRIFKMSVADLAEIAAVHTERHIGQIEAALT